MHGVKSSVITAYNFRYLLTSTRHFGAGLSRSHAFLSSKLSSLRQRNTTSENIFPRGKRKQVKVVRIAVHQLPDVNISHASGL
jgi:hypothetical protein